MIAISTCAIDMSGYMLSTSARASSLVRGAHSAFGMRTLKGFRAAILLSHSPQRVCNISAFRSVILQPRSVIPNYGERLSATCVSVPAQVCARRRVCVCVCVTQRASFKTKAGALGSLVSFQAVVSSHLEL